MKKAMLRHAAAAGLIAMLCLFCRCGSLSSPVAGGSGAGNPGGAVAVTMSANIIASTTTSKVLAKTSAPPFDSSKLITVSDKTGLNLTIAHVVFADFSLHFMLDSTLVPSDVLTTTHGKSSGLACDQNSIVVDCLGGFDALQGITDSSVAGLILPIARYTGVELYFPEISMPDNEYQSGCDSTAQILISGSFPFEGETHPFVVRIAYSECPPKPLYPFSGGIFTLSPTDTTNLQLQFNAQNWFSEINIGLGLASGYFSFDSTGTLNITNRSDDPAAWAGTAISRDVLASGSLWVH